MTGLRQLTKPSMKRGASSPQLPHVLVRYYRRTRPSVAVGAQEEVETELVARGRVRATSTDLASGLYRY